MIIGFIGSVGAGTLAQPSMVMAVNTMTPILCRICNLIGLNFFIYIGIQPIATAMPVKQIKIISILR